jgi:hypothetical protein
MHHHKATAVAHTDRSHASTPATAERRTERTRPSSARAHEKVASGNAPSEVTPAVVSQWDPELRDRVKAVLNRGARLELAADHFQSAEQFVTVAHAARDTEIPFMVLKDRVVNHGQSLADAIRASRPDLNASAEVARARAAARSDLAMTS